MQKNYEREVQSVTSPRSEKLSQRRPVKAARGKPYVVMPSAEKAPYVPKKRYAYRFVKRVCDIISSGLFLIVFSWLFIIISLIIKLGDGGKVIYKQPRIGKGGKHIYISKFRSMKPNADKLEDMLTPEQLEQYRREFKLDNYPRITKIGKFLRKTSLDELPQVWDVFVGRLSVVGPRPLLEDELREKYGSDAQKLLSVKPGIIGWWAVNGRSNVTYESGERQRLELYYVDHCSLMFDAKILFKAIVSVVKRDGAK